MKATILNNSKNFLMGCAVSVSLVAWPSPPLKKDLLWSSRAIH